MGSHSLVRLGFVIEGHGEVEAVPLLVRRICQELYFDFSVQTSRPVRVTKSKLLRGDELERAVRLAVANTESQGPVLIVFDADDDCPATPDLRTRASAAAGTDRISVVIPKYEFETWFLTAARSLAGKRGLEEDLSSPSNPHEIRGAKEWLDRHMTRGHKYSPTVDQAALVSSIDLQATRACRSFDRLCREIGRLIQT